MTEVNWALEKLDSVVDSVAEKYSLENGDPVNVIRVNRNESAVFDDGDSIDMSEAIHNRKEDLERGVIVGIQHVERAPSPVGTEYDHRLETILGVRIEGLTCQNGNFGHIDPTDEDGIPFDALTRRVRRTLLSARTYPDTDVPHTSYDDLVFTSETDNSWRWRDFYRYDIDCALRGYEELPGQ